MIFFGDFMCAMFALARFEGLTVVLLKIQVHLQSVSEWGEDVISLCRQDDLDGGQ